MAVIGGNTTFPALGAWRTRNSFAPQTNESRACTATFLPSVSTPLTGEHLPVPQVPCLHVLPLHHTEALP